MADCSIPRFKVVNVAGDEDGLEKDFDAQRERINWAHSILGVPSLWWSTKGKGVKVAVLDTGIDEDHRDFEHAIVAKRDFTGDGMEDVNGHGTHVAGVIGARQNNFGFVGVAPECSLMIGKVLGNNGSGSYYWIAAGIDWAVKEGADIINLSLGGPSNSNVLHAAIYRALAAGVTVCCAAGNAGSMTQNNIGYPGRYGGVLTIASHDWNGNRSGFSSRGGELDVMGPGSNIWSTYKNGGFAELSGTSMATPFVSGLCALILAKHKDNPGSSTPINNCEDMREHLLRMAAHPGYYDNTRGYGPLEPFRYFYE